MPDAKVVHHPPMLSQEAGRKAMHLSNIWVPIAYAQGFSRNILLVVIGAATLVAVVIEWARRTQPSARGTVDRYFGWLLRDHEKAGVTGATWLLGAAFLAVLLLSRNAAVAALWCVTAGDTAAALVGRAWSAITTKAKPSSGKTIAGSLACLTACVVGVWAIAGYSPIDSFWIGLAATLAERFRGPIDDNARIVLAAGVIGQLLA